MARWQRAAVLFVRGAPDTHRDIDPLTRVPVYFAAFAQVPPSAVGARKALKGNLFSRIFSAHPRRNSGTNWNSDAAAAQAVRRVLWAQATLTLIAAAGFGFANGWPATVAAIYGGGVVVLISAWQGWRLRRLNSNAGGANALGSLYLGVIQRYAAVFALLGLGLGVWQLSPLPLVSAFAAAQLGYWTRI